MELNNIQGITDSKITAKLQFLSKEILSNGVELNIDWVQSHKWIVVPTESGITARDEEWLSNAFAAYGYNEFFAIVTEPKPINFQGYLVQANKQGIFEVHDQCSANHYLLIPEDQGFAIFRPFGLYSIIAGPKRFVEMAVGSTIETAREMFWEFANDSCWQEDDREFLTGIAQRCKSMSQS